MAEQHGLLVKDAQGAQVNSDTLFVERPRFRFSV